MAPRILSQQETTIIVGLIDSEEAKSISLQKNRDAFFQYFKEEQSRVRALYALRALLSMEYQSNNVMMPTTTETLSMLFLLLCSASFNENENNNNSSCGSKDFAKAALYEHLLRLDDLLRDHSLLMEQRKYKATAAVGKKSSSSSSSTSTSVHEATEKDAHRGHLFQKVFIIQCALQFSGNTTTKFVDLSESIEKLFSSAATTSGDSTTNVAVSNATTEQLEGIVSSWGESQSTSSAFSSSSSSPSRSSIMDLIVLLKKSWEKEIIGAQLVTPSTSAISNTNSSTPSGSPNSGSNTSSTGPLAALAAAVAANQQKSSSAVDSNVGLGLMLGYSSKNVEIPAVVDSSQGELLRQSKLGAKHYFSGGGDNVDNNNNNSNNNKKSTILSSPLQNETTLHPQSAVRAPPKGKIISDAKLLLPPASPLLLDNVTHPHDWREGKQIIDQALSSTELSNSQLQKLTSLLAADNNITAASSSSGKNQKANTSSSTSNKKDSSSSNTINNGDQHLQLFPFLGVTPQVFGQLARSNPKAAVLITQHIDKSMSEAYMTKLVEFNSEKPDCSSVVLAASRNSLLSSSHLTSYVKSAKTYCSSLGTDAQRVEFLKQYAVSLHQVVEKTTMESSDKQAVAALIAAQGTALSEVAKMWSS